MHLLTDEQTTGDLGIVGKRRGDGIIDLYNHTSTRGGEGVLKHFFLHPLSDREEINRRARLIEQFALQKTSFHFEPEDFDMAEKYLARADKKNDGSEGVLSEKEMHNGVTALIKLIQQIRTFIEAPELIANTAYAKERQRMMVLLNDIAFTPVLKEKADRKIAYAAVAAYDVLFRQQAYGKVRELIGYLYHLDVYLSIARLAVERNFCFPAAVDEGGIVLRLKGVYHPALKRPVCNDVALSGTSNLLFLTGANMAGKSTFLRALSIAVYVAHIGFPVAAQSMEFAVLDGIYTTINLPDNLGIGASHFYNEVLRVKKVASELSNGKSLFVVFDELFRGTNVKDAQEGTIAVASAFANNNNSLFIISSHIVEAGEELQKQAAIQFRYLPTRMKGHEPEYTYRLEEGITDDRHGMIIIRNEGILEILKNGLAGRTIKMRL